MTIGYGSSIASDAAEDGSDATSLDLVFRQYDFEPGSINPPTYSEGEMAKMAYNLHDRSVKLEASLQEIRATTNYLLEAGRRRPEGLAMKIEDPETGQRMKLGGVGLGRLSRWLESSMDILKIYLSSDGADGLEEETEGRDGSDVNRELFLLCSEGYKALTEEVDHLTSIVNVDHNEATPPLSNEVHLVEEFRRFLNWGSYTGVKEGQLAILINHPLYKQIRGVLEKVTVTLITLCEECFIKESSFAPSSLVGKLLGAFFVLYGES